MNNMEAVAKKKVVILTEQHRNMNDAYVDTLAELLVARETISELEQKLQELDVTKTVTTK